MDMNRRYWVLQKRSGQNNVWLITSGCHCFLSRQPTDDEHMIVCVIEDTLSTSQLVHEDNEAHPPDPAHPRGYPRGGKT